LLDAHSVLRRIDRARAAGKLLAVGGLADIGGAKVERIFGRINVDRVEEISVEDFDARDVRIPERRELLNERDVIHAEIDQSHAGGGSERLRVVEAGDARSAPANVRLHDDGESQVTGSFRSERAIVDHPRSRIREVELLEYVELERLRNLHLVGGGTVHERNSDPLEVTQPAQSMKGYLLVSAQVRRRTRSIENQRVGRLSLGRIVVMRRGIDARVGYLAPIELGEQRLEPIRMLVVDRDRSIGCCRHCILRGIAEKGERPRPGRDAAYGVQPSAQIYQVKRSAVACAANSRKQAAAFSIPACQPAKRFGSRRAKS